MKKTEKRKIGDLGEDLAFDFLKKNSYTILERNFYKTFGEIDIIVLKDDVISFVEVKTRKNEDFGYPSEFVNSFKQERIRKTAEAYLLENNLSDYIISFDVIEVLMDKRKIKHIANAF